MADGTAQCWGRGGRGEIGDRTTTDHFKAAPVMLPLLATAWKAFNCAKFITDPCQSNTNSVKVAQITL